MAKHHVLLAIWLTSLAAIPSASAEEFPTRPITWVVPFAPGGITDTLARITAERLQTAFSRSFIVENQAGAAGVIATERVARADPDVTRCCSPPSRRLR